VTGEENNVGDRAELWSVEDVSAFLRVPVETLYRWRKRKYGPPAARVGRHLRYDPADVRAWFRSQAVA
jgi:predicted DNA-binding transcriptional regulator AlpA